MKTLGQTSCTGYLINVESLVKEDEEDVLLKSLQSCRSRQIPGCLKHTVKLRKMNERSVYRSHSSSWDLGSGRCFLQRLPEDVTLVE